MLAGGADWVVSLAAERRFFERLGTEEKRMRVFNGMYHDILHEKDRQLVLEEIRSFVRKAFAGEKPSPGYTQTNFTHIEYERLCRPLPILSPNRLWYATQRVFMKTYGRLSAGIHLGWKTGFDSGSSLDYIYENRARGSLLIGRLIDRIYLNTPAWVGIRQRKANIEKLLRNAIVRVNDTGAKVQLLDVATGQGRYVLETLAALADRNITAVLRDYTEANVEAGRAKAACLGLQGIRFERADAFSPESYTVLNPRPNIVIVSGLFELFSDNALVRQCLKGLTEVIEEGGYLIYTGQPWHPQIEMIARVLVNHRGEPWRMRRRPQGELDELVREAGFRKIVTEVGGRGIFTVSLAQKGSYNQNSF
jgi:2-polyprenyl-3-methyl-5-hydroxy-6-metoxy-1,4-benzoquinol methylase